MKKKIVLGIFCLMLAKSIVFAAPVASITPQGAIQDVGTVNTHDLDTLKRFEAEKRIEKDYKKLKKSNEIKEEEKEKIKKEKKTPEKAKIEEYTTKGVYIENIIVSPSEILNEIEISNTVEDYTKKNLTFLDLEELVNKINKLYLEKGYVTARAYLPEQTIENETVRIELIEGKIGEVLISNNKWNRKKYIESRLNLKKGEVFNIQELEENIMVFNRYNNSIMLKGSLEAGKTQLGTTDINIEAEERSPIHFSAIFDNAGRKTIGTTRSGLILQHDSLLGFQDRLSAGIFLNKAFNTPFVDYNIPVNKKDGRIGFSFSSSDSKIKHGPYSIFNIKSKSRNYSLYFSQPLYRRPWTELTSVTSLSYKKSTTSFDGVQIFKDEIAEATTGLNFRYDTKRGIWYLNQNVSYAFPIFDKDISYLRIDGNALRLHDFGHGFIGTLKSSYQVIPNKRVVPYADQFMAGGATTVRGYSEGLLIGRSGYLISAELMFPVAPRTIKNKDKTKEYPFLGSIMKGFVFADHAGIFPYKGTGLGSEHYTSDDFLISVGAGIKFTLPKDINIKLSWGFPLMRNGHEENSKCGRFHFEMSITPDFDALLRLRKPKNKNIEQVRNIETNPLEKEDTKISNNNKNNNNDKVKITRPVGQYLAQKNKDLAKEFVKPKTTIEFKNVDFKNIEKTK